MINNFNSISEAIAFSRDLLKTYGEIIRTESWQGIKKEMDMFEYLNLYWSAQMPNSLIRLQEQTKASQPWCNLHFEERIGEIPLNPGETYKIWPGYKDANFNDKHFRNVNEKFSHTYMERYWPKAAGGKDNIGIRYPYGDLNDVVNLLKKEPYTRQAYLPIFFPEDTGAVHGGRIPCTIGYHFIMRHNRLHIHYQIRACDFIRHFRNDIYLTVRLAMWLLHELKTYGMDDEEPWCDVELGLLTMDIVSLHVFAQEKNLI